MKRQDVVKEAMISYYEQQALAWAKASIKIALREGGLENYAYACEKAREFQLKANGLKGV